jgi:hypothetical protein
MTQAPGPRLRSAGMVILGVVLVASVLAVSPTPARAVGSRIGAPGASACSAIIAEAPTINSTLFQEVCAEPAFQAAYQEAGLGNFTYGEAGGPNGGYLTWQFSWEAPCTNSTLKGMSCTFGEYWLGYPSNSTVMGPFTTQSLSACGCGLVPRTNSVVAPEDVVTAAILVAAAIVGVGVAISAKGLKLPPQRPKS